MKRNRMSESWSRYLEAERLGREEEAQVALLALFSESLERPGPAPGFADRVFARLAPLVPLARRSLFARRSVRLALAASLAVAGLGAGLLAPMVPPLAGLVEPGKLFGGLVGLVSDLAVRFANGVAAWQIVGDTVSTLARAVTNPTVVGLLLLQLLLAAAALRGLSALVSKEGSFGHVS